MREHSLRREAHCSSRKPRWRAGSWIAIGLAAITGSAVSAAPAGSDPPEQAPPPGNERPPKDATAPEAIEPVPLPEVPPVVQTGQEPGQAPVPGDESGRIDPADPGDSALRIGLRGALFIPKLAVNVVMSPLRLTAWAYARYHLNDLYYRVFFNDAQTIGLVPTGSFDTSFGFTAGARFVHRDLFGDGEHLSVEASAGGRYRQVYKAALISGNRLGPLKVELDTQYELRPKDPFYGIGNVDDTARPPVPVDPATMPVAVDTRYRERIARVAGVIDLPVVGDLHLRNSSELTDRTFAASDTSEGLPIDAVYAPATLVGFDGIRYVYSELELRYDSRRSFDNYEPRVFYSRGSLAAIFAGRTHRVDGGPDYWRYGVDFQHFLRLSDGPRVLAMRLRGEAVSGDRMTVPFSELPQLGGADELRGYPADRFRDRALALGSLEYEWDLSELLSTSLFVDAGRVFAQPGDVGFDHLRVGYGLAFQTHTQTSFAFQGSVASSVDGGLMFSLSLNPVFGIDERVRRR